MDTTVEFSSSRIILTGPLTFDTVSDVYHAIFEGLEKDTGPTPLVIDLSRATRLDSAGVALINELEEYSRDRKRDCDIRVTDDKIRETLHSFSYIKEKSAEKKPEKPSPLLVTADRFLTLKENFILFIIMFTDTLFFSFKSTFSKRLFRKDAFLEHCLSIGVNALSIIGLMSFLIGLILALQSAAQLRQFGANIFIANLIGIAMVREMGPLMTAIMLAGRSGSAFASEIATMKVTEEIDALKMMGLNPTGFIIAPKFLAISVVTPLLTIYSDFLGIFGGFIVGLVYLDLPPEAFFNQLFASISVYDITVGLFKSLVFAWIIAIVGSFFGIRVKGGAEGVGKVTTQSVVTSIFMVILADSLFSLIFYFGG